MNNTIRRRLAAISANRALTHLRTDERFGANGDRIVFAPAAHGSFGDEALVFGTGNLLDHHGQGWKLVAPGDLAPWRSLGVGSAMTLDAGLGGAVWSPPAAEVGPIGGAVVIGADGVDFSYGIRHVSAKLSALNLAAASGACATLFNFSLKKSISKLGARLLRRVAPDVRICARDPFSMERAREVFGRDDVSAAPDVGIFLTPLTTDASRRLADWARVRRTAALTINNHLGVNFSDIDMADYFTNLGRVLEAAGYDVLVVAHDIRARQGDPELAREVATRLSQSARAAIPASAREAKAMLEVVDIHVTSRMHAGIATLSRGVPTIGLDYVDKFRGQFSWYGAADLVVNWHAGDVVERVTEMVEQVGHDETIRETLLMNTAKWKEHPEAWRIG